MQQNVRIMLKLFRRFTVLDLLILFTAVALLGNVNRTASSYCGKGWKMVTVMCPHVEWDTDANQWRVCYSGGKTAETKRT